MLLVYFATRQRSRIHQKALNRTDEPHARCKPPQGADAYSGKTCIFPRRSRFPFLKRRHRRPRCFVIQPSIKTDKESYEKSLRLRQFVPAFVSRTSPVGGSLTGIHQSSGTLGLRAILSLNIHQFGILKIQTPFPAPILTARTNRLFPQELRYRCFL